jgi:hypothetical protein
MCRKYGRWEKELRKVEFALLRHIKGEECSQESSLEGGDAEVMSYLILSGWKRGENIHSHYTKNYPSTYQTTKTMLQLDFSDQEEPLVADGGSLVTT